MKISDADYQFSVTATPDLEDDTADIHYVPAPCQVACPIGTDAPSYIAYIWEGKNEDALEAITATNPFSAICGRVCDAPCEPACRRADSEDEAVAICRLKRVAADNKDEVGDLLPTAPKQSNGKRVALIGAGPASLTVARDLAPLGYELVLYDGDRRGGGMIRSQIPRFRLPESVIDEEVDYILNIGGIETRFGVWVNSLKEILDEGYDAVFVGTGAPRGRDLDIPGRQEAAAHIHIGIDWLSNVSFGHIDKIGRRVVVLGGGNTAMDCCRTSRRLGGDQVTVVVRSGFEEMKASPWEKEDAMHEGIPILNFLVPKAFLHDNGKLTGIQFEKVEAQYDDNGRRRLVPTGEPDTIIECDDVLVAIGQENAFPWIERDIGMEFDKWDMPVVDQTTFQSTVPNVFFGGDSAFGPKNIIWAVAHGHEAAVSIDKLCRGEDVNDRLPPHVNLSSQKMGIHEWSYDNDISNAIRHKVPLREQEVALKDIKAEVELGFDQGLGYAETQRCLNCDVQTVFTTPLCIECDACVDICPMDCISFTENGPEEDLRHRLNAPADNLTQSLYISSQLKTGRIMAKDEDLCLHCGLCAERCPTGAWDMQKFLLEVAHASETVACRN